jgi:hypothetical protein
MDLANYGKDSMSAGKSADFLELKSPACPIRRVQAFPIIHRRMRRSEIDTEDCFFAQKNLLGNHASPRKTKVPHLFEKTKAAK